MNRLSLLLLSAPFLIAADHSTRARPNGPLIDLISADDYPSEALRTMQEGTTGYMLDIDKSGGVTNCTIAATSGSSLLDDTTCSVLKQRAKFQPALNASGRPVAAQYSGRVRWLIPRGQSDPFVPQDGMMEFDVLPDGSIANCSIKDNTGTVADFAAACARISANRLKPRAKTTHVRMTAKIEIENPLKPDGSQ